MSMLNKKRAGELLTLTTKMTQAPSYSGQESLVVDVMKKFCDEHKFTDIHVGRCGNCIYHIKESKPGPKILSDDYMDMIPVPDKTKWDHDPFGAEIVGGGIYGRGTSDMKDALSAMLAAVLCYTEDTDYGFPGDVYVAGVVHKERFEGVTAGEISAYVKPDYVIIGKTSRLNMKIGQRGRTEIVVETFGVPVHSANPRKDVNAVYKMCKVIKEINKLTPPHHDVLGNGIPGLVDMKSSPCLGASVVPDYCRATYNRRLFTGETKGSILAPLQKLLDDMMKEGPQLKTKISYAVGQEKCWTGETVGAEHFFLGWLFDKNESWVQNIYKGIKEIGLNPTITSYNFCTNASHYVGEAGIHSVGVGPFLETLAHTISEYVEIDQLNKVMRSYYGVVRTPLE